MFLRRRIHPLVLIVLPINNQNYEKKSTNKSEAKKSTRTRENKISPKTKGMGTYRITIFMLFTLIVERKLHKASPGNEQAFHVRKSNK